MRSPGERARLDRAPTPGLRPVPRKGESMRVTNASKSAAKVEAIVAPGDTLDVSPELGADLIAARVGIVEAPNAPTPGTVDLHPEPAPAVVGDPGLEQPEPVAAVEAPKAAAKAAAKRKR